MQVTTVPAALNGFSSYTSMSPWQFVFASATVVWVSDDSNLAGWNLRQFSAPSGTWAQTTTVSLSTLPIYSFTGRTEAAGYVLYATTTLSLYRYVTATHVNTVIATAPAYAYFKGVALAPIGTAAVLESASPFNTQSSTASRSITATNTGTASITPTNTASVSMSRTLSSSASISSGASPSITPTGTASPSNTPSSSVTASQTASQTSSQTATPTNTGTPSQTGTATSTQTTTPSQTSTPTGTSSGTPSPSITHTLGVSASFTATPSLTPTMSNEIDSYYVADVLGESSRLRVYAGAV